MKRKILDWGLTTCLGIVTLSIFLQPMLWLGAHALAVKQMSHGLLVLGSCAVFFWMERKANPKWNFVFTNRAIGHLTAAFALAALSIYLQAPAVLTIAWSFAIAAWVSFFFGDKALHSSMPILAAFGIFVLLAMWMPVLDWPLRLMTGSYVTDMLKAFGFLAQLELSMAGPPVLTLIVGSHPYRIAAECNGFGLLSATLMLSVILSVYRRLKWFDALLLLNLAAFIALCFNLLRILTIVILAPPVFIYEFVHEAAGLFFYWGALALLWWIASGLPSKSRTASANVGPC
jgi:exosortase/archaeosortase family protein